MFNVAHVVAHLQGSWQGGRQCFVWRAGSDLAGGCMGGGAWAGSELAVDCVVVMWQ